MDRLQTMIYLMDVLLILGLIALHTIGVMFLIGLFSAFIAVIIIFVSKRNEIKLKNEVTK